MPLKQLSGLDASFLYLEKPEMPMHVGAMVLLELPAGYRGRYVNDLRRHYAARMPATPALRRRLWWMPLNLANPAWVDAEPDLAYHIVEHKLPSRPCRQAAAQDARTLLEEAISQREAQEGAVYIQGQSLRVRPDLDMVIEGGASLRKPGVSVYLEYQAAGWELARLEQAASN